VTLSRRRQCAADSDGPSRESCSPAVRRCSTASSVWFTAIKRGYAAVDVIDWVWLTVEFGQDDDVADVGDGHAGTPPRGWAAAGLNTQAFLETAPQRSDWFRTLSSKRHTRSSIPLFTPRVRTPIFGLLCAVFRSKREAKITIIATNYTSSARTKCFTLSWETVRGTRYSPPPVSAGDCTVSDTELTPRQNGYLQVLCLFPQGTSRSSPAQ
jgi:hypothetical protein